MPEILTSNAQFNDWLNRSFVDLHMMRTETPYGPYPYAGVPWFSTVFGRDGIITALQCLPFNPAMARGVLASWLQRRRDAENAEQDAQPGKILHETRRGEMAALGEIPFSRYYGTIDATPLFVMLAGAYASVQTTGTSSDRSGRISSWPSSGSIATETRTTMGSSIPRGAHRMGWSIKAGKTRTTAIFHADGRLADGPIALSEVQGYVYAAKLSMSQLAERLGDHARAKRLAMQAESLKRRFDEAFWCEDLSTYALALDGQKKPCRVRTSNAGHCLFTGIATGEHAGLWPRR